MSQSAFLAGDHAKPRAPFGPVVVPMIDEAIIFLRDRLNAALESGADPAGGGLTEEKVVFPDGEKLREMVEFKMGAVTAMLVNVEEETTLRPADRFLRTARDGTTMRASPEIRLGMNVIFVCHFKQYGDSLKHLSQVIQFFQSHRIFTRASSPTLSERIEQLTVELLTLSFAEQNEIWGSLRTSPRPSVLYRVRMVVFRDQIPQAVGQVDEPELRIHA